MQDTLHTLLQKLISFPSLTPNDAGCQAFMMSFLQQQGFRCQHFDNPRVANFFADSGVDGPLLVFAGHTDVVPVGDASAWRTPPFQLTEKDGLSYGRGVADMKGSLASMLLAAADFIKQYPKRKGRLGFLITSGEEGDDFQLGTPHVMKQLQQQGRLPNYCVVGEPSSHKNVGDVIKIGRRGSLTGKISLKGKQGHVAYPHLAINPIHTLSPALLELTQTRWDEGNTYFPPTSLQITHLHAGGEANNIIPGELTLHFNIRYSTEHTYQSLQNAVQACFARHALTPDIHWQLNGEPFLTENGYLLQQATHVIEKITGKKPELSTSGGTSDGRFIAPYNVEVIELGPINATIHQANECVALTDLETLRRMYYALCEKILL